MLPARPHGSEPTLLVRQARGPAGAVVLEAIAPGGPSTGELAVWATRLGWPGAVVLWLGDVSPVGTDPAAAAVLFTEGTRAGLVAIGVAPAFDGAGLHERLAREAVEVARAAGCRQLELGEAPAAALGAEARRRLGCLPTGPDGAWCAEL